MKTGYYFYACNKDYFIETRQTKKTRLFCKQVLENCGFPVSEGNIEYLRQAMQRATLCIKSAGDFKYYDICGENFGGCGTGVDDGRTIVISL